MQSSMYAMAIMYRKSKKKYWPKTANLSYLYIIYLGSKLTDEHCQYCNRNKNEGWEKVSRYQKIK